MRLMFEWDADKEKFLKESLETETRQDVAGALGCHLATVKRAIKRFGIKYKKKSGGHYLYRDNPLDPKLELTDDQQDLMIGSLLGDGFLLNSDIFRIKQKRTRREYVEFLHKQFSPFVTPIRVDKSRKPTRLKDGTVSHKMEDWKGEYSWAASFSTRKHRVFEDLRRKWYPEGKKELPSDLKLNPKIVTHWYLQDGHHNKSKGYYKFCTQSFSVDEAQKLSDLLNDFVSVQSDVQLASSQPVIYVTKTRGEDVLADFFRKNISFRCFQYKI